MEDNIWYGKDYKVGVLGGGQLGRMLIQAANSYDVAIYCMDGDANAPCSKIAHGFTHGDIQNYDDVYAFGKDKDVVTVEIEHVNVAALKQLAAEGVAVYPQPAILEMIQDKGLQKEFYTKNNIPTAPFRLITTQAELSQNESFLPFVQKMRKGGYDGKGVKAIQTAKDFEDGFDVPSVLEQFVDFEKELAVIVARNENGEVKTFPTVACEFSKTLNLVEFLYAPADISSEIEEKAQAIAKDIIEKLGMVGLLAVELFLTKDGELLVNEIAPRPHNSGHHTIESNITSQFEQHLRAITNRPLGATDIIQAGVMVNLLGEPGHEGPTFLEGFDRVMAMPNVHVHLYGKATTKPHRKMGHVTICAKDMDTAKSNALAVKAILKVKAR
jgi:5-(carboxyamino)imidazole ribonucleotide synthase